MTDLLYSRRIRASELLSAAGFDAAAFVPGANFYYLTGLNFPLMERPTILFITRKGEVAGIIPELERLKWSESFPGCPAFYWQDSDGFEEAFAAAASELGRIRMGVEGGRMRMFEYAALCRHFSADAVLDAETCLRELRIAKDAREVRLLQEAVNISETALAETVEQVRAGMTERQVMSLLKTRMLANEAEGFSFEPLVLAGAKSANPHGTPGDDVIRLGDALLFDFGASSSGYNADITRTFFVGQVSDEHESIYETVRLANETGRNKCGPQLTADGLDVLVQGVLGETYPELIVHKTGHGLGLDVHEAPQVMVGNHTRLAPGMIITIEPGLYRSGDLGVRIEDDVLIEDQGSTSLTGFPRELRILG